MSEITAITERNIESLPEMFDQWMTLPDPITLGEPDIEITDEAVRYLDRFTKEIDRLRELGKFDQAVALPSKVKAVLTGTDVSFVRSFLLRHRALALGWYVEESGMFPSLEKAHVGRSRIYLSAAVDDLRADIEMGFPIPALSSAPDYLWSAGMGRLAFAVGGRFTEGEMHQALLPVPPSIRKLEEKILEKRSFDYSRLVLVPALFTI